MSQDPHYSSEVSPQADNFISRYNFSRRVLDHRIPHDFSYSINSSNPRIHYHAHLNHWKSYLISNFGLSMAIGAFAVVGVLITFDVYYREMTQPLYKRNKAYQCNLSDKPGLNFIFYRNNRLNDKGKWNHNFSCWEKDPNCGRDFDIQVLKK